MATDPLWAYKKLVLDMFINQAFKPYQRYQLILQRMRRHTSTRMFQQLNPFP